jgi:(2Fe-2S) ferredoxin
MSKTAMLNFQLRGQIRQLIPCQDGQGWKALDLQVDSGLTYRIKVAKAIDDPMFAQLEVGQRVGIVGVGKPSKAGAMPKLKALRLLPEDSFAVESENSGAIAPLAGFCRLQICTKGSCRKRGAKQLQHQLETWVQEQGLGDRVSVEATGCLKACKQGPNVRLLPLGQQFSGVTPELLATLAEQLL